MAIKQALAVAALDEAAGRIIKPSLCEIPGGWLALVETEDGNVWQELYKAKKPRLRNGL